MKSDFRDSKVFLQHVHNLRRINEARYIALFVVSGSIKKLFSIYCINIYLLSIFFFNRFCSLEKCGVTPRCLYIRNSLTLKTFWNWHWTNSQLNTFSNVNNNDTNNNAHDVAAVLFSLTSNPSCFAQKWMNQAYCENCRALPEDIMTQF